MFANRFEADVTYSCADNECRNGNYGNGLSRTGDDTSRNGNENENCRLTANANCTMTGSGWRRFEIGRRS